MFKLWKYGAEVGVLQVAIGFVLFVWTESVPWAAFCVAWLTGLRAASREGGGWHDPKTQMLGVAIGAAATICLATGYPQGWPFAALTGMCTVLLAYAVAVTHAHELNEKEEELFWAIFPGIGILVGAGMLLLRLWRWDHRSAEVE